MTLLRLLLLIFVGTSVLLLPCSCVESAKREEAFGFTLPAYALISNWKLLNSTTCSKELEEFHKAIVEKRFWSLRALDSSGQPRSGFLYGNNYWMGKKSQCKDMDLENGKPLTTIKEERINNSLYQSVKDEQPPFDFRYYVAYAKHNSSLQYSVNIPYENLVMLGLCLPDSCTTQELETILEEIFKNRTLIVNDLYAVDFELLWVKDFKDDRRWLLSAGTIIVGLLVLLTILLMVVGTFYDVLTRRKKRSLKKLQSCENNNTTIQMSTKETQENPEDEQTSSEGPSVLARVIQCFSIYTNTTIILSTKLSSSSIPNIHGLRFLGMLWIMMVHTLLYMKDVADNRVWAWKASENFYAQIMANASLSVDTFLVVSGFLLTYLYLISKESKQIHLLSRATLLKNYLLSFLKRFIRLTPTYMMTLGLTQINFNWYQRSSEFYMSERPQETCEKYWWRNLLYIQNLFPKEHMCMSWSWYLAIDMQYYVIGTAILLLSSMYLHVAIGLLNLLLLGSIVITGYLTYAYQYIPTLDEQYRLQDLLYYAPWVRIGPYIIGMFTAFISLKLNKKLELKKKTLFLLWIIGSSCNVIALFGLTNKNISLLASTFYVATYRTLWAIGIGWIIIACNTNNAGIVDKILSFKGWVPLSKLTYCAYLLNPAIITSVYLYSETSMHVDFLSTTMLFLGLFVCTYICAFFFSVMFEAPYVLLMRLILMSRSNKV